MSKFREAMAGIIMRSRDDVCKECGAVIEADNPETTTEILFSLRVDGCRLAVVKDEVRKCSNCGAIIPDRMEGSNLCGDCEDTLIMGADND